MQQQYPGEFAEHTDTHFRAIDPLFPVIPLALESVTHLDTYEDDGEMAFQKHDAFTQCLHVYPLRQSALAIKITEHAGLGNHSCLLLFTSGRCETELWRGKVSELCQLPPLYQCGYVRFEIRILGVPQQVKANFTITYINIAERDQLDAVMTSANTTQPGWKFRIPRLDVERNAVDTGRVLIANRGADRLKQFASVLSPVTEAAMALDAQIKTLAKQCRDIIEQDGKTRCCLYGA